METHGQAQGPLELERQKEDGAEERRGEPRRGWPGAKGRPGCWRLGRQHPGQIAQFRPVSAGLDGFRLDQQVSRV